MLIIEPCDDVEIPKKDDVSSSGYDTGSSRLGMVLVFIVPDSSVHRVHVLSIPFQLCIYMVYICMYMYRKRKREKAERAHDTFRSHSDRVSRFDDVELELPQIEGNERIERTPNGIGWIRILWQSRKTAAARLLPSRRHTLWSCLIFEYPGKFNRRIPLFGLVKISAMFERCKNRQ